LLLLQGVQRFPVGFVDDIITGGSKLIPKLKPTAAKKIVTASVGTVACTQCLNICAARNAQMVDEAGNVKFCSSPNSIAMNCNCLQDA
jgi:hypothetical protein